MQSLDDITEMNTSRIRNEVLGMKNTSIMQHSSRNRSAPFKRVSVIVAIVAVAACAAFFSGAVMCKDQPAAAIKSVHSKITIVYADSSVKSKSAEAWIVLPNKYRAETVDSLRIRNGRNEWILNKRNNRYHVNHRPSDPPIQVQRWSTPDSSVDAWRHVRPDLTKTNIKKQLDGVERDAVEVVLPDVKGGSQRIDYFPDKVSGRIMTKITYQLDGKGGLVSTERVDYEYNRDIDEKLFKFVSPAGAVLVQDMADLKWAPDAYLK